MNESESNKKVGRGQSLSAGTVAKRKLAVMPLAVLLPSAGDLSHLSGARDQLEARLEELQGEQLEGSEEGETKRLGEEAMLFQVLQWLNLGAAK
jgi:hypothetical protein